MDYALMPLNRLIGTAELIVAGRVVQIGESSLTVRVEQTLAGTAPAGDLEIRQFVPSRFEDVPRATPYAPGQSFLWFLMRDDQGRWRPMGAAGQGEAAVKDGFVYLKSAEIDGYPVQSHPVHGAWRETLRFEAQPFFDAVKGYRSCFEWKSEGGGRPKASRTCDEAALERFARSSPIHRYLASRHRGAP